MEYQKQSRPTVIDEDGKPFIDADPRAQRSAGTPFGASFGMPGAGTPLPPPIPERLLNRKGKLSLARLLGWKGIAVLLLVVAGVIALAAASVMVLVFALPVLLLLGVIGAVATRVRGPRGPAAGAQGRQIIVVRR